MNLSHLSLLRADREGRTVTLNKGRVLGPIQVLTLSTWEISQQSKSLFGAQSGFSLLWDEVKQGQPSKVLASLGCDAP